MPETSATGSTVEPVEAPVGTATPAQAPAAGMPANSLASLAQRHVELEKQLTATTAKVFGISDREREFASAERVHQMVRTYTRAGHPAAPDIEKLNENDLKRYGEMLAADPGKADSKNKFMSDSEPLPTAGVSAVMRTLLVTRHIELEKQETRTNGEMSGEPEHVKVFATASTVKRVLDAYAHARFDTPAAVKAFYAPDLAAHAATLAENARQAGLRAEYLLNPAPSTGQSPGTDPHKEVDSRFAASLDADVLLRGHQADPPAIGVKVKVGTWAAPIGSLLNSMNKGEPEFAAVPRTTARLHKYGWLKEVDGKLKVVSRTDPQLQDLSSVEREQQQAKLQDLKRAEAAVSELGRLFVANRDEFIKRTEQNTRDATLRATAFQTLAWAAEPFPRAERHTRSQPHVAPLSQGRPASPVGAAAVVSREPRLVAAAAIPSVMDRGHRGYRDRTTGSTDAERQRERSRSPVATPPGRS